VRSYRQLDLTKTILLTSGGRRATPVALSRWIRWILREALTANELHDAIVQVIRNDTGEEGEAPPAGDAPFAGRGAARTVRILLVEDTRSTSSSPNGR